MDREEPQGPDYYRLKAEIMRQQAERADGAHLRFIYRSIADGWEAMAEDDMAGQDG